MRIGIDLQGLQSEGSRTRGIGRYSLEIVRNLIRVSPNHGTAYDLVGTKNINKESVLYCFNIIKKIIKNRK